MSEQDDELREEMIIESKEHLKEIEPDLLGMEEDGANVSEELINRVFRAMHSIKGGVMFFGLTTIGKLAHTMENLLSDIREKRAQVTPELVDALLKGVDKLNTLLDDPDSSNDQSIEIELEQLAPFSGANAQAKATVATENTGPLARIKFLETFSELTESDISGKKAIGKYFFHITVNPATDLIPNGHDVPWIREELGKLGKVLSEVLSENADPETGERSFAFSSVLDESFIRAAFDFPQSSIRPLEKEPKKVEEKQKAEKATKEGSPKPSHAQAEETLRIKLSLLDRMVKLAGELVLSRNQLLRAMNQSFFEIPELSDFTNNINESIENGINCISNAEEKAQLENHLASARQSIQNMLSTQMGEFSVIKPVIQNMDRVTGNLQESIMGMRMQPISTIFAKFPRVIRDISRKLGKNIALKTMGETVELDKTLIELLADPLTHLIRNSADHGIEKPDDRKAAGKPPTGTVLLRAFHESGKVNIEISDDGKGMVPAKILETALRKNLIKEEDSKKLSDSEIMNLIFKPGFSTAEKVGDLSGRGVGMDVVRTNIEKLNGDIDMVSTPGEGTKITLRLPLTLAIIPSIIVSKDKDHFAIPQVGVEELVRIRYDEQKDRLFRLQGSDVLKLRDKLLPLVRLSDVLDREEQIIDPKIGKAIPDRRSNYSDRRQNLESENSNVNEEHRQKKDRRSTKQKALRIIVLKSGQNRFGLVVDSVNDIEEIVVQRISSYLQGIEIFAGSAIMGDGSVAMILDPTGIASNMKLQFSDLKSRETDLQMQEKREEERKQAMLLCKQGESSRMALSLELVERIEKVRFDSFQEIGGKFFLNYEKESLQLSFLNNHLPIEAINPDSEWVYVIIPKLVKHPMGIVVQEIEDISYESFELDSENLKEPGILGTALIRGSLTMLLDLYGFFEMADPEHYSKAEGDSSLEGKRILFAEDTKFFRSILRDYLKDFGCEIDEAEDGLIAWEKISNNAGKKYDLVLSDIEMPRMNGYEFAEKVKTSSSLKGTPIIAMTSLDSGRFERQGGNKNRYFDAYEHKLDKSSLKKILKEFL